MDTITRKPEIKERLEECFNQYRRSGLIVAATTFNERILQAKVQFPLLEYCAHQFNKELKETQLIPFCDEIEKLKTIGGNVILGIILQNRLATHFNSAIAQASVYISKADAWYVCDIIGERVFGYALLHHFPKAEEQISKLSKHPSQWVVRSLGAGIHHAVKKGLPKAEVRSLFILLLSLAGSRNKEIKQGTGWAAKTTAKFHPDIIHEFESTIEDRTQVGQWFRTKISIGLKRNKYAKGN